MIKILTSIKYYICKIKRTANVFGQHTYFKQTGFFLRQYVLYLTKCMSMVNESNT